MAELFSSAELRAVLRFSLKPSASSSFVDFAAGGVPDLDVDSPALRHLIEQIVFSRWFINTYYAAIGGIVVLFALLHWGRRLSRARRRRQNPRRDKEEKQTSTPDEENLPSSNASSSSITLQGDEVSPKHSPKLVADESTPLISNNETSSPSRPSLVKRIKAFLMYQPASVPAITASSNQLPDNGTTLLILLFLGLNVFYLFFHTPLSVRMLFAFADRAGLCFVANIPILYVLAAKNLGPLKWLTGWSYEGLNIFHRRLGEWMIILAVLHTVGMFGVWYTLLRPFHFTLLHFLSTKLVILGLLAFTAYLAIWATSTGLARQFYYEYFLGLHLVLQVAALVFLFFHHSHTRPYVLASLGIWALDRILVRMMVSPVRVLGTLNLADDRETVLLECQIEITKSTSWLPRTRITHGWQPGQHTFVTLPCLGLGHKLQTHPFTIASPAPPKDYVGAWPLQLIVRAKDGFSRDVLDLAQKTRRDTRTDGPPEIEVPIILDGPYGSNDTLDALRTSDRQCLIAGGSGVAVTYPYAWDLLVDNGTNALTYAQYQDSDGDMGICPKPDHHPFAPWDTIFHHLWIASRGLHRRWVRIWPSYSSMKLQDPSPHSSGSGADGFGQPEVGNLLSWTPYTQATRSGGTRPDIGWALREWVAGHYFKSKGAASSKDESVCVVVSGPDGMVRDVRNAAAELVREGWDLEVHVEKFGW